MLIEVNISNYILIDDIRLNLKNGLSSITGETGAGKSIFLEAIRIALGSKVSKFELKDKEKKAVFEVVFDLEDDIYVVSRELFPSGKTISRINSTVVKQEDVMKFALENISIHAQKDDNLLLYPSYQLKLIDTFSKDKISPVLDDVSLLIEKIEHIDSRIDELSKLKTEDLDEIKFKYEELNSLNIIVEEDEAIEKKFNLISKSKYMSDNVRDIVLQFEEDGILSKLYNVERSLGRIIEHDDELIDIENRIKQSVYELEDISEYVNRYLANLEIDKEEINYIEQRFEELFYAKKKYQTDIGGLFSLKEEYFNKIHSLENLDCERSELEKRKDLLLKEYNSKSEILRRMRKEELKKLEREIRPVLDMVGLENINLTAISNRRKQTLHKKGAYTFEIGVKGKSIRTTLSGGEMSRFMLALKMIFIDIEKINTVIFDEVDSGISGITADKVASLLKKLSAEKQVISITHLPQLVSYSDNHFFIEKNKEGTTIRELEYEEHIQNLALMMTSNVNDSSLLAAKKMIERSRGKK